MGILAAAEIADFSERSNITHLLHFHAREQSNLNLPLSAGERPSGVIGIPGCRALQTKCCLRLWMQSVSLSTFLLSIKPTV